MTWPLVNQFIHLKKKCKTKCIWLYIHFALSIYRTRGPCGCEGALTRQMIRVWDVFTINKSLDIYITTHHGSSLPKDGRDARITIFYQTEKCLLCKLLINSSRTLIILLNNANKDDYCEIYERGYFTFNDNNSWQT